MIAIEYNQIIIVRDCFLLLYLVFTFSNRFLIEERDAPDEKLIKSRGSMKKQNH